jgi:hypothetical protein
MPHFNEDQRDANVYGDMRKLADFDLHADDTTVTAVTYHSLISRAHWLHQFGKT